MVVDRGAELPGAAQTVGREPAERSSQAADDELLQSQNVWDSNHQDPGSETDSNTALTSAASTEAIYDHPHSPTESFEEIAFPEQDAEGWESDYEEIGSEDDIPQDDVPQDDIPQGDGGVETSRAVHFEQGDRESGPKRQSRTIYAAGKQPPVPQPQTGNETMEAGGSAEYDTNWDQAGMAGIDEYQHRELTVGEGTNADTQDLAGPGAHGRLECQVTKPQKEGEGTQNPYVSYLVITDTDFKSFQESHIQARRRYTDFVFLYKTLAREYPQCAVPPLPDKHNMAYVRGDRFGPDFTARRAYSLQRFLKRITLHPVLRRSTIFNLFLESTDWNATMKSRPTRGMSGSEAGSSSVLETWTDSFLNAFTKPHKTDKRFQDVNDRANKLDDDLGTVSKTVARVAKREGDLETDYADLATQFQKLAALEPGVQDELTKFATSVQSTSEGWKGLKEHTDQDYLGSLKDMESYITSIKALLKTREQKQLDFEGLTDYLTKAAQERDTLASHGSMGASGFLRQKIEDVRGVDHEQSRRERQRKLEVQISRLTTEVETAKKTSEAFDEEVVKEVGDFERIKAVEFRDTLGGLAEANIAFFQGNLEIWERFVREMEREQAEAGAGQGVVSPSSEG